MGPAILPFYKLLGGVMLLVQGSFLYSKGWNQGFRGQTGAGTGAGQVGPGPGKEDCPGFCGLCWGRCGLPMWGQARGECVGGTGCSAPFCWEWAG